MTPLTAGRGNPKSLESLPEDELRQRPTRQYVAQGEQPETQSRTSRVAALTRISHRLYTAAAHPGMSTALRSVGLPDVLSSAPAEPSVARLESMPVCAASLRNLVRNAG